MRAAKSTGAIAAGHPLTAEAGAEILRAGGNAFDAIIAAHFAACAVEPVLASLGGGGFMLCQLPTGTARVFDFFVQTPVQKRRESELDFRPIVADFGETQQEFHIGLGSVATPGAVKGMFEIHRQLGSLPMHELVQPAIEYARNGNRINSLQAYIFSIVSPILLASAESRKLYAQPDTSRVIAENHCLRMPELADTLEHLAREGDDLFYLGEMGALIAAQSQGQGQLSREDLAAYSVVVREPLVTGYQGEQFITNAPPSSGGILINFALQLLQGLSAAAVPEPEQLCKLVRVMAATNQARMEAGAQDRVGDAGNGAGDALLDADLLERYRQEIIGRGRANRGTTHISVIDAERNLATMTVSNGEGCGHMVPGCGVMLNNMLGEEDLNPDGFGQWEPNQRMTSMMSPSVINFRANRSIALGSGGSNRIRTAILQTIVNLIDRGFSLDDAVHFPRLHHERGFLNIEAGFDRESLDALTREFPQHKVWQEQNLFFGGVHAVEIDGTELRGVGDSRRGGVAILV